MITELDLRYADGSDADWERFVREHPGHTVFHTLGWLDAVEAAFGYEPRHALVYESDGDPVAAVPGFGVADPPGKSTVNPFCEYGYPLVADRVETADVLETLATDVGPIGARIVKDGRWSRVETSAYPAAGYGAVLTGTTVRLPLRRPYSELRDRAFDADVRRTLEESDDERISVETGSVDEFYPLYLETMRRLGSPPFPAAFFDELVERLPGSSTILLARVDGRAAAAVLLLEWDGTTIVWANASKRQYWDRGVNQRVYARGVERACRAGKRVVDFGRSRPGSSVERFKRGFGDRVRTLVSYVTPPHRVRRASFDQFEAIAPLARRFAPLLSNRTVGPAIKRFIHE